MVQLLNVIKYLNLGFVDISSIPFRESNILELQLILHSHSYNTITVTIIIITFAKISVSRSSLPIDAVDTIVCNIVVNSPAHN